MNQLVKNVFPLIILIFLIGCTEDIYQPPIEDEGIDLNLDKGDYVLGSVYGVVLDEENYPLSNVTVQVGDEITQTNELGYFYIYEKGMYSKRTVVYFTKPDYFSTVRVVQADNDESNYIALKLQREQQLGSISGTNGGIISNDIIELEFPADAFDGYSGEVSIFTSYIDPTSDDFLSIAPSFDAVNIEDQLGALISFGMLNVEIRASNGNEIEIAEGKEVTLRVKVPEELKSQAPSQLPLWYFYEQEGAWVEEGSAVYNDGVYEGLVSHFTLWNLDIWEETTCDIEFQFVDQNQVNIEQNLLFEFTVETSSGATYISSSCSLSDGSFDACLPNDAVSYTVSVFPLIYDDNGFNVCELTTIEFSELSTTEINYLEVLYGIEEVFVANGNITDCDDAPLDFGLVTFESTSGQSFSAIINNGVFDIENIMCSSELDEQFTMTLFDANTDGISEPFTIPLDQLQNISASVCGNDIENDIIWVGDLDYTSQSDEFLAGNYNIVQGNIIVSNENIDVNNLINLKRVEGGSIFIGDLTEACNVANVSALINLEETLGLNISICNQLPQVVLPKLETLKSLKLDSLGMLENISLPVLESLEDIELNSNIGIKDLNFLSNVTTSINSASFSLNQSLYDYCGLDGLSNANNYFAERNQYNPTIEMLNNGSCKPADNDWLSLGSYNNKSAALKSDGTIWAWGENHYFNPKPFNMDNENVWIYIDYGGNRGMAIREDNSLWELHPTTFATPIQIGNTTDWQIAIGGYFHYLALKENGTLWAWGDNEQGEYGNGTTEGSETPIQIGTTTWRNIATDNSSSSGIKEDGTLWAWGDNNYGNLGIGDTGVNSSENILSPVQVGIDSDWESISMNSFHTLALKEDGSLWTWGTNNDGQFGDGTTEDSYIPIQVGTDSNWKEVSAGGDFSIGLKTDGTLWAWGSNNKGQLGDGTFQSSNSPIQVGTDADWSKIRAGRNHTIAIKQDGTLWAWGSNSDGQLSNDEIQESNVPTQVTF